MKDPANFIKGKTIESVETVMYDRWIILHFTDGTSIKFRAVEHSMMFNDRWPAVVMEMVATDA